ncbi:MULTISPECIES: tautomerase family protein [unclassified Burkholderia]|uniref:tautomerase family protein n=1 Tax=unclassified Burkholderia TaxID=2613784 RepID=UPI000F57E470|nr:MULTISPECIES: tautomerase family protein [unclassified Burkholderia]RQR36044.1 4-oxalocrotonate tautomerase [Burkholderia sp. Bp9142]RQR46648.1 4-oxalocrotonate tautomerase [Burkholderia sp. Bp9140]
MPILTLEMLSGRTEEQKIELADVLTRETARIAKCALQDVQVIFAEVPHVNWAVGGKLASKKNAPGSESE